MLIDWFTVGAQALNFLILVWLMKRFLYQPILRAIDAREARIAKVIADADARKVEAQEQQDEFRLKNETFDRERADLLVQATEAANAERDRLLDAARDAADAQSAQRRESLASDARNLSAAIRRQVQTEVFAIARRTLNDLATTELEQSLAGVFIRRLRALDDAARAGLAAAFEGASEPALVRSAFLLPAEQRAAIQHALNETLSADVPLRFETAPDVVSGIELTANGQKVAWSIAHYLGSLERNVGELVASKSAPAPAKP